MFIINPAAFILLVLHTVCQFIFAIAVLHNMPQLDKKRLVKIFHLPINIANNILEFSTPQSTIARRKR